MQAKKYGDPFVFAHLTPLFLLTPSWDWDSRCVRADGQGSQPKNSCVPFSHRGAIRPGLLLPRIVVLEGL